MRKVFFICIKSRCPMSHGEDIDGASSQGLVYKSRIRTEPTNLTAPQWSSAMWTRLESLIEDLSSCCIKVRHSFDGFAVRVLIAY